MQEKLVSSLCQREVLRGVSFSTLARNQIFGLNKGKWDEINKLKLQEK